MRPRIHAGLVATVGFMASLYVSAAPHRAPPPRPSSRSTLRLVQVQFSSHTPARPSALRAWALELRLRTSVRIAQEPVFVRGGSPALLRYPLLILAGSGPLGPIGAKVVARLREHLSAGGLLLIDDIGRSGPSARFDRDVRKLIKRALGQHLRPISAKDVLYRTFYRLDRPVGRRANSGVLEGVRIGRRWAVLYSRNDLLGAFERSSGGGNARPVLPGGERQRELAWRLGINLVLYATTLDYKDDHTHIGHLLRHRRGR